MRIIVIMGHISRYQRVVPHKYRSLLQNIDLFCRALLQKRPMISRDMDALCRTLDRSRDSQFQFVCFVLLLHFPRELSYENVSSHLQGGEDA